MSTPAEHRDKAESYTADALAILGNLYDETYDARTVLVSEAQVIATLALVHATLGARS